MKKRIRGIVAVICLLAALTLVASGQLCDMLDTPEGYDSRHPACTPPPLMGLSEQSVFNVGDAETLDAFPGVGEVISQRIIDTREALGGYIFPEDLMLVKGVGEKTFAKIMGVWDEVLVPVETAQEIAENP